MLTKIRKKYTAVRTAAQAGWIAGACIRKNLIFKCQVDDETGVITPCHRHKDEIARLADLNAEAQ